MRQGVRDLDYISWGGSLGLELLLEAGAVRSMALCFNSLDVFGLAPRFRRVVEEGSVPLEEWTALGMMQGFHAAQHGVPSMPFPLPHGSEIVERSGFATPYPDPVTGAEVGAARALPLDVFLLHAQRADEEGNVEIQGGARSRPELHLCRAGRCWSRSRRSFPRRRFRRAPRRASFIVPRSFVAGIAAVPFGAYPTSCLPYYPTDYRELLRLTSGERLDDRAADRTAVGRSCPRRRSSRPSASPPRCCSGIGPGRRSRRRRPPDEVMVAWLARQIDNDSVCSVGSVSPLATVAYLLAKRTHAPDLVLMTSNGGLIDVAARPMLMTLAEPLDFQTAAVHCGGDESYHWYYQRGRVTHEVVSAAQIDRFANTNNIEVISPSGKRIRLPGQGGMADVANMHRHFLLYLTRHSPLSLVERVEYVSAARGLLGDEERMAAGYQPGEVKLVTNLGVFELDEASRELVLVSVHPGGTVEAIQEATGFSVPARAGPGGDALSPTADELSLIRREIDPLGMRRLEFVAGKERGPLLAALIESEEAAIAEMIGKGARPCRPLSCGA